MESTSLPGQIQISQATADILTKNGKEAWFTPRSDKVEAKGKGLMQTYFVKVGVGSKSGHSPTTADFSETMQSSQGELNYDGGPNLTGDDRDGDNLSEGSLQLEDQIHQYFGKHDRPSNSGEAKSLGTGRFGSSRVEL